MNVNMVCTYHCPNWMNFKRLQRTADSRKYHSTIIENGQITEKFNLFLKLYTQISCGHIRTRQRRQNQMRLDPSDMRPWHQAWVCSIGNLNSTEHFQLDQNLLCKRVYKSACSPILYPTHSFHSLYFVLSIFSGILIWYSICVWWLFGAWFLHDISNLALFFRMCGSFFCLNRNKRL